MLTYETTHDYQLSNASLFYCAAHDTLRVCDNFTDSVLLSGVTKQDINDFIEKYLEYVYEDTELAASFKKAVKKKVETSSYEVS